MVKFSQKLSPKCEYDDNTPTRSDAFMNTESLSAAVGQTNFTVLDWGIVVVYLLISLVIGLVVRRYVSNMASYVTAGRAVGTRLGIETMMGT